MHAKEPDELCALYRTALVVEFDNEERGGELNKHCINVKKKKNLVFLWFAKEFETYSVEKKQGLGWVKSVEVSAYIYWWILI